MNRAKKMMKEIFHRFIYQRKRGFEYPSRLVSVMFVAGCVIYVVTVEFLVFCVNIFNLALSALTTSIDSIDPTDPSAESVKELLAAAYYITYVIKASTIVSITLASLMSLLTILHMMKSFRTNLYALYRGDFKNIPPPSDTSATSLCVGSIKFAGYQVAYIFWSYIISCLALFVICIILAVVICLLIAGVTDWLVNKVLQIWPGFAIAVALYITQLCLAKWVFLQDKGQHLRLNNRRFYFVFTYFMFFFNIFMGLMSCLMRILKAIGVGIIFLARLDKSTLPRSFEFFDPGFSAYQGFIYMEVAHTHPVVSVFIRLLMSMSVKKKGSRKYELSEMQVANGNSIMIKKRRIKDAAKFNWHVTYTLLHNPVVRIYRKGYIQSLKKAREEGIKIPISDRLITDFDLVKSREQKEKERLEELEKIKSMKQKCQEEIEADCTNPMNEKGEMIALNEIIPKEKTNRRQKQMISFV